jgi:membrane protein DedA with SNARE-associated domain
VSLPPVLLPPLLLGPSPLSGLVEHYGYVGLGGLVFVESFGVPAPGQTAIIVSAGYAAKGHLNVVGVAIVAFLAAVTGDSLGYLIGRTGGHALILRFGKYVGLNHDRMMRVEKFMDRHGPKVIVIARFIEGLRQFNGVIAGATEVPWVKFLIFNAIGAALWVGVWTTAGYLAGEHISAILAAATRYQWYAVVVVGLAIVGYVALHVRRRRRNGKSEPERPVGGASAG